jgi:parvulin-like peptidyl-prolyl isomerase
MKRIALGLVLFAFACEDKYKQMEQQADASASAAAAASASALAQTLAAAASATPPPPKVHTPAGDWITCQHILVAYKGAKNAPYSVTRTKDEAKKRAAEALAKVKDPSSDFEDVVALYSDDAASKDRRGSLGKIKRDGVVKEFGDAAWALDEGEVSGVVETPFGFHIIKRNQ